MSKLNEVSRYPTEMYNKEVLVEGFKRWSELMNYESSSLYSYPVQVRFFLDYVSSDQSCNLRAISTDDVKGFFAMLATHKSERTGKVLSLGSLRTYMSALNRFGRYCRQMYQINISVPVSFKGKEATERPVLSKAQVRALYEQCRDDSLGLRDRASLAVYYGCGLRRSEGAALQLKDILLDRHLIYVRKGKNYKERYVPMTGSVQRHLIEYIRYGRPDLIQGHRHDALFVAVTGRPLAGSGLYERLKRLLEKAGIEEPVGLHSLRHSIATHLLEAGMSLKDIARFLGHATLESTQIYTHIHEKGLSV